MYQFVYNKISGLLLRQVPATGIGLFRILYGLVTLQEICFLYYFNHLIFDPVPYIDVEFPGIPLFLCLWGLVAAGVVVGYRYQFAVTANYVFWIVFVNFTPMQRDFDGGFDTFMIGVGFFLLLMPGDRAFSIDSLRYKLRSPFVHYSNYPPATVSALMYHLPIIVCLGWLYLDSDVHKLFAEHWRNGLGSWLPATQPFYVSALDMSPLLNIEWLEKAMGYTIMAFQLTFVFFYAHRRLRAIYFGIGLGLHLGIAVVLNIYPFGLGMLICYVLLVPFRWWRKLSGWLKPKRPALTVFYDQQCPLCNRTVLTLNHFDMFGCIDFKSAQEHANKYPALAPIGIATLLTDLYALDGRNRVYSGVGTYRQILLKMRYTAVFGVLLGLPGIRHVAERKYRAIADSRLRIACGAECPIEPPLPDTTLYHQVFERYAGHKPKALSTKLTRAMIILLFLQSNSTVHYGIFYRLPIDYEKMAISKPMSQASNALLMVSSTFLGITPHALYLHDHFKGYDRILAITYVEPNGAERWLPFVNEQGRLLAPNWGRVHSMWANIAVTPTINNQRLRKFVMKVTAFWGQKMGVNFDDAVFKIKMKKIDAPTYWVYDQLHKNFLSQWVTIGSAKWTDRQISFDLPADINSL
jgi:predicted DCC family thiol-disulfide oxidoreductase YuxK